MTNTQEFKFCVNEFCPEFGRPVRVNFDICPMCKRGEFAVEEGVLIVNGEILMDSLDRARVPVTYCPDCGEPAHEESNPPPCWNCD
ncbi:hypothetical protein [Natrinema salaciae]|uniref:hypothetical protein n=1 Tax=Natrinema salaciae TaxID=1186196 RepID=UPI0011141E1C|nr:hypothetical protein [Natrinema salaciae]